MIEEVKSLLDEYTRWVKDRTSVRELEDSIEISTPYLDRHNDQLQIYVQKELGGYLLSDDAYIINDLLDSGLDINTQKRRELLNQVINGFGVKLKDDEIIAHANPGNFVQKKHDLVQAMLAINDMFYLAAPTVTTIFYEDVQHWLQQTDIRFISKVKLTGNNGLDHVFDFSIPASRKYPMRILQTVNRLNKEKTEALSFAWVNTRRVRPETSIGFALINDTEYNPNTSLMEALKTYDIRPILWSRRDEVYEELAA